MLSAIPGLGMDIGATQQMHLAAFEAANPQVSSGGGQQQSQEDQRLCAVCNDQARGRHYGIFRFVHVYIIAQSRVFLQLRRMQGVLQEKHSK